MRRIKDIILRIREPRTLRLIKIVLVIIMFIVALITGNVDMLLRGVTEVLIGVP